MSLRSPRVYVVLALLLPVGCVDLTKPWERSGADRDGAATDGVVRDLAGPAADRIPGGEETSLPAGDAALSRETDGGVEVASVLADGPSDPGAASALDSSQAGREAGGPTEARPMDIAVDLAVDAALDAPWAGGADLGDANRAGTGGAGGRDAAGTGGAGGRDAAGTGGAGGRDAAGTGGAGGRDAAGTGGASGIDTGSGGFGGSGGGGTGPGGAGGSANDAASGGNDGAADARPGAWKVIANSSPQHAYPGASYDPALQRAVLFGGHTSCAEDAPTNQTWEWDGATWTLATPAGSVPSARGSIRMAFDRARGVAIVHGGWAPADNPQPGTYSYNLATHTWTSLGTDLANIGWYAIDYDTEAQRIRLFGGNLKTTFYRDVRSWDPSTQTWPGVAPSGPSARARHSWTYDQQHRLFVMFGGFTSWGGSACLPETWEYDPAASTWQQTATATAHPEACDTPPLVYDPRRKVVVLYEHLNGGATWEYDAGTHLWKSVAGANQVGATSAATIFYDERLQSVLLVGGCNAGGLQGATWQYQPPQ
ncbi:MAG: hypothetical protein JXP73_20415 [Deltaproteobacteria bacterium]|nr:hypothetical protein [Deltaproteobacteria bacterium]